jgi:DNA-binding protein HU-beta
MPAKRTIHRSTGGKKPYAERDAKGRIKDIQTFKRAHGQDVKRWAKAERGGKESVSRR